MKAGSGLLLVAALAASGAAHAAPLTVTASSRLWVEASGEPGGLLISGGLDDDSGRPAAGRRVLLAAAARAGGPPRHFDAWTEADGSFLRRLSVPPGEYTVAASFPGEALLEGARARADAASEPAAPRGSAEPLPTWLYLLPATVTAGLLLLLWLAAAGPRVLAALGRLLRPAPVRRKARGRAEPPAAPAGPRVAVGPREAVRRAWHRVATARAGGQVWGLRTPAEVLGDRPDDRALAELTHLCEEACFSARVPDPTAVQRAESLAAGAAGRSAW